MSTIRKLISASLRSIGVLPTGQVPSAVQANTALAALNSLMGNLSTSQLNTHTVKHQRFLLQAGKQYYTLGPEFDQDGNPTGADWVTERPIRIEQAKLMKYFSVDEEIIQTNQTLYYPLQTMNDEMWSAIVLRKMSSGWPTCFYDDGAYPLRKLGFWPIPQQTDAVELWTWEPLFTYENLDVHLDLPIGYERYLRLKLAVELAPEFGTTASPALKATLKEAEANIRKLNQQMTIVKMSALGAALNPAGSVFNPNLNSGITATRS